MSTRGTWLSVKKSLAPWADYLDEGVTAVLGVALSFLLALLLGIVVSRLLGALTRGGHIPLNMAIRLKRSFWWLLAFVVFASVLQSTHLFEQAWAVLSAVLLASAVGFIALWSVLSNAVCALLILAFRPFRLGDEVEILDPSDRKAGMLGRVSDLSLMFTTLESEGDDERVALYRVPNNIFFQRAIRVSFARNTMHDPFFGKSEAP